MNKIRQALIDAGVKQLREFGYPSCDGDGIMKDLVLASFFAEMLKGTKGKSASVDAEIDIILSELQRVVAPDAHKTK